jgi:hypothetical protein
VCSGLASRWLGKQSHDDAVGLVIMMNNAARLALE